ncbi:MAG: nitroreductase family protein [Rubrivivax sp.]|nr:nitroreductase family protein [Rubrivivax sp.]
MISPEFALAAQRLFTGARTHAQWQARPVAPELLRQLYELVKQGPTSMNCQPLRLLFVQSDDAKARLLACVNPGNVAKTSGAPVVAILGQDLDFASRLPTLFAHKTDAVSYYEGKPGQIERLKGNPIGPWDCLSTSESTALRNSSLQAGYLILAARLLGLDCGPMSGFNAAAVDREFWAGTSVRTNMLCNLGYGDVSALKAAYPRLSLDEACGFV